MITSRISVEDKEKIVEEVFAAEEKEFQSGRAEYALTREKDTLHVDVKASDASALRAVLNSVCKVLITFEKAKGVTQNGK